MLPCFLDITTLDLLLDTHFNDVVCAAVLCKAKILD